MLTTKYLSLELWKENYAVAVIIQGEANARILEITVLDDGEGYDLTNSSVQFHMTKPDGNVVFNNATIKDAENGIVQVTVSAAMSAAEGFATGCELHIVTAQGVQLKVKGLNLYIQKALSVSTVTSSSEFTALTTALASCTQIVYTQQSASETWVYEHNLNKLPKVTITDSSNNIIAADVEYIDSNTIKVKVSPACTGKIIIN